MISQVRTLDPPRKPRRSRIVSEQLIAALEERSDDGVPVLRKVISACITEALAGDTLAIRLIFDRVEGRAPEADWADEETQAPQRVMLGWASSKQAS